MLNLITELTNGTVEYKDGGTMVTHAPTSLMLRAARALKEVATINETNGILINQLQSQLQQLMQDNESLRKNRGPASDVGSGDERPGSSNTDSTGNATP